MMKKTLKYIFLSVFVLCGAVLQAAINENLTAFPVAGIGSSARAAAMGGAYSASLGDAAAFSYNPAGLSTVKRGSINLVFNKWSGDAFLQHVVLNVPGQNGSFGAMFSYVDMGKVDNYDDFGQPTGTQSGAFGVQGAASYGIMINDNFMAGLGVNFLFDSFDTYSETGMFADAGMIYKADNTLSFGLSARNIGVIGDGMNSLSFAGGAEYSGLNFGDYLITASLDMSYHMSHGFYAAAGLEAKAFGIVSLRAGYSAGAEIMETGPLTGLTCGVGINLMEMKIEYAAESFGDLGFTHMASVGYSFAPSREDQDGKLYRVLSDFMAGQYYNEGIALFSEKKYEAAAEKFRAALEINPDYGGAEDWKEKAEKAYTVEREERKVEAVFDEGVNAYDKGDYKKAVVKWEAVMAAMSSYNDVGAWIEDAKKMIKYGPKIKEAIKFFRTGYKKYGSCLYTEAVDSWLKAVELDPDNRKYQVMLEKARQKSLDLNNGLLKAEKDIKGGRVVEGAISLRQFAAVCPTNTRVAGKMDAMKEIISEKCRELYMQGLDRYVSGMTMDAVKSWSQIQELDPKSEYNKRAVENINKAKLKLKNIKELNKK